MALAGVLLEASFARLKTSMKPFNAEMTPSRSLGCRDSDSMIEVQGRCMRIGQRGGLGEGLIGISASLVVEYLVQTCPSGEENRIGS